MKRPLFLLACAVVGAALSAQTADVAPPQRREPTVARATELAAPPKPVALPAELKNPFAPAARPAAAAGPAAPAARASDRALLERLAPLVTPSGTMHVGGEPILLFGQKRIKVGDPLPITFDGVPYVLVISAIDRTSFTLRLNGEEITRPIKPANRP